MVSFVLKFNTPTVLGLDKIQYNNWNNPYKPSALFVGHSQTSQKFHGACSNIFPKYE